MEESFVGKKVRGFRFEGYPTFTSKMEDFIGVIGVVEAQGRYCEVKFDEYHSFYYPKDKIKENLVEEEEDVIDINVLLRKIMSYGT